MALGIKECFFFVNVFLLKENLLTDSPIFGKELIGPLSVNS
jgi:hypothetical protein